jgi:hypothetical protein
MKMARLPKWFSWRPAPGTIAGGILFITGLLLTGISWKFLSISVVGTFGPGILREFGLLRDQDEFQRRATRRAGYHAFLATGFVAFLIVAYYRAGGAGLGEPEAIVSMLLSLLWFTWLLSSLVAYWGPHRMARTILYAFGLVWLAFAILSNSGAEYMGPMAIIMQSLVAVPFLALAIISKRWPRVSGILLVAASAFFFYLFRLYRIFGPEPLKMGRGEVIIFFFGPLVTGGLALLFGKRKTDEDDEPEPAAAGLQ